MDVKTFWGASKQYIQGWRRQLAVWNVQTSSLLINFTLIAMLLLSGLLIVMAIAQVRLTVFPGGIQPGLIRDISEWTLGLFLPEGALAQADKGEARATLIGTLVSAAGAIVTAVFAVVAWLFSLVEKNARSRRQAIENIPVFDQSGSDDISVMILEYQYASRIIVFGGDFSWMRYGQDIDDANLPKANASNKVIRMRELVEKLAEDNRLKMISYGDEEQVKRSIGDRLYSNLRKCIQFRPDLKDLRASFITTRFGRVLLYKVYADGNEMHICKVTERTRDGKELLDQFERLIKYVDRENN